mmetsp:Transcript_34694/g.51767  ORF Transcript_34694/g.51767 Transcript_34694/m.51767 type:complete len:211 (+) Transcript_34694:410-1042(+)
MSLVKAVKKATGSEMAKMQRQLWKSQRVRLMLEEMPMKQRHSWPRITLPQRAPLCTETHQKMTGIMIWFKNGLDLFLERQKIFISQRIILRCNDTIDLQPHQIHHLRLFIKGLVLCRIRVELRDYYEGVLFFHHTAQIHLGNGFSSRLGVDLDGQEKKQTIHIQNTNHKQVEREVLNFRRNFVYRRDGWEITCFSAAENLCLVPTPPSSS